MSDSRQAQGHRCCKIPHCTHQHVNPQHSGLQFLGKHSPVFSPRPERGSRLRAGALRKFPPGLLASRLAGGRFLDVRGKGGYRGQSCPKPSSGHTRCISSSWRSILTITIDTGGCTTVGWRLQVWSCRLWLWLRRLSEKWRGLRSHSCC
jgi:hypothetical protein